MWPRTVGEDFAAEFNTCVLVRTSEVIDPLGLRFSAQRDVLEHLSHLVHLVGAALHLEFLNEKLLVFPREGCLIEQTRA